MRYLALLLIAGSLVAQTTVINGWGGGGSFGTITGQPTDNSNLLTALGATPLAANCLYEYRFAEGSGTTLADSCNSNGGTLGTSTNAPTWVSALPLPGLQFSGNQYVTIPATVWASVKTLYFVYRPNIAGIKAATNGQAVLMSSDSNSQYIGSYSVQAGTMFLTDGTTATRPSVKPVGNTVLAVTFDTAQHFYLNGIEVPGYVATSTTTPGTATTVRLGGLTSAANYGWWGVVGYASAYSAIHTPAQVAQNTAYIQGLLRTRGVSFLDESSKAVRVYQDGDSLGVNFSVFKWVSSWQASATALMPIPVDFWGLAVVNNQLTNMLTPAQSYLDPLIKANGQIPQIALIHACTNDLNSGRTAAQCYTDTQTYTTARKTAGASTVVVTTTSRTGTADTTRAALNTSIRDGFIAKTLAADGVAFWGSDPNMGQTGQYSTTWYRDNVHPSDAGHAIGGFYIAPAIMRAIGQGSVPVYLRFTVSNNAATNWTISANGATAGPGAAISAATTQAIPLYFLGPKYKVCGVILKTNTAFTATGLSSLTATVGDSVGGSTFYTSSTYDLTASVSNSNFQDNLLRKSSTWDGSNITLNLTANQNLNAQAGLSGSVDVTVCVSSTP